MHNNVIISFFLFSVISCGSQSQAPKNSDDTAFNNNVISCEINSKDGAWQQGYRMAQLICEHGSYGSTRSLCNPYLQIECTNGAKAYLSAHHCPDQRMSRHDALLRVCPVN